MATQIYNTAMMKTKAGEIETQNAELKSIIAEMEGVVGELSSVWKDSAKTKFVQQFNNLKPELDDFCKSIASFAERATKHANDVEKAEGVI